MGLFDLIVLLDDGNHFFLLQIQGQASLKDLS